MKFANNNIETLPLDVIVMLMELLSASGFENCFNFFVAWARTQRPAVIMSLLEGLPLHSMLKFGNMGGDADKACFQRFINIAANLGFADAILHRGLREILYGHGNIGASVAAINGLADNGHFVSTIARFLVTICQHPDYITGLVPAFNHLGAIYSSLRSRQIRTESSVELGCPIHSSDREIASLSCSV